MYRLLVADDEKIIRDSYKDMIEKNYKNIEIELVRSGLEAIESVMKNAPDLVIMDINMPGIKGIDAIREIKKVNRDIVYIIISAYDDFYFAKDAISLDVFEYIVKPVKKDIFIDVINRALTRVEELRSKRVIELKNRERIEKVLPALEHNFIYSLLLNSNYEEELESYADIFDYRESGGYIMVVEFVAEFGEETDKKLDMKYTMINAYMFLINRMKKELRCLAGPLLNNKITIFVPLNKKKDNYFEKSAALSGAEIITRIMDKLNGIGYRIGLGSCQPLDELYKSYEEAMKILVNCDKGVCHIDDLKINIENTEEQLIELKEELSKYVIKGKSQEANNTFNDIIDVISQRYFNSSNQEERIENMKNEVIELFSVLFHKLLCERKDIASILNKSEFIKEVISQKDIHAIKSWALKKLNTSIEFIKEKSKQEINSTVSESLSYMEEHFREEITLEEMARKLYITPQYLSKLFKDNTGRNFSEYIIHIRLEKAKELMEKTNMSIKEISIEVGYNDPNYFSRLFKKETGVTPSEFTKKK